MSQPMIQAGSFIKILDGTNYSDWKDTVEFSLGYMDLDYALRVEQPPTPQIEDSKEVKDAYEWWEQSNRLSLMLIKSSVSKSIRGAIGDCDTIKDFMHAIEQQFVRSDKAMASTLMKKLTSKTFHNSKGIRAHITEMRDLATQRKDLKIDISESFLVHFILDSLPSEYGPFKISYNTHKEEWSITELLAMCVQEEERIKHDKPESANMVVHDKAKDENKVNMSQNKRKRKVSSYVKGDKKST